MKTNSLLRSLIFLITIMPLTHPVQQTRENAALDARVKKFLEAHKDQWHDLNVPFVDGQLLYDLIIKGNYQRALEIGTSTGHSGIWMAWALSKTGGKLITVEIDKERRKQALANYKEAGVSDFVDSRLADAHVFVKEIQGPFDFVFSDADKEWYKQYFIDVAPKLAVGGCFTAHNVPGREGGWPGIPEFVKHVLSRKNFETSFNTSGGGMSISYKKAAH